MTNATITWSCTEINVTYTVTSSSLMSPFPEILQKSFTLKNLEEHTNYTVSITAKNECGESEPSENITVRIDGPGTVYNSM